MDTHKTSSYHTERPVIKRPDNKQRLFTKRPVTERPGCETSRLPTRLLFKLSGQMLLTKKQIPLYTTSIGNLYPIAGC